MTYEEAQHAIALNGLRPISRRCIAGFGSISFFDPLARALIAIVELHVGRLGDSNASEY